MNKYEIIYHYFNEETAVHEWKVKMLGQVGFLELDDLEKRGQNRINDNFFNKYSEYIKWEQ
jgi:hypothetical protein